ncbi:DUF1656 domain-containing protein [Kaistia dalseonensis]|uniref:DUF1656 domain-containing protein n=1 Tax=Kaistia dalseonensis TaxID=410840 RepID=A0ABU0H8X7_9HYPH|nr:DUF1656 domain-containing protein [Kaistia dalseonensis]MCX5495597.1 DUF1656 domain-containing protein [Kaistia dalseonensis]MDQ0438190.1 hypothetical protein [Kaistia dalseonensis]
MFTEVNILGVFISPFVVMMFAAWLIITPVTMITTRYRLFSRMWHPGLFNLCLYVITLSLIVIYFGEYP